MAKQILIGIEEQELSEIAHYLMIYFPYNEEMCSYTDAWMGDCMRTNIRWLLKEEDTVYELPWKYECLDDCQRYLYEISKIPKYRRNSDLDATYYI